MDVIFYWDKKLPNVEYENGQHLIPGSIFKVAEEIVDKGYHIMIQNVNTGRILWAGDNDKMFWKDPTDG